MPIFAGPRVTPLAEDRSTDRATPRGTTFAVIVNWNGGEQNLSCIQSLLDQGLNAEAIVFVDNASTDGSTERSVAAFPGLLVLPNDRNMGFGHAVNRGIATALERGAKRVFLANNDMEFPAGNLERLEEALDRDPSLGIVGPRVVYRDRPDIVWAAGGCLSFRQNLTTLIAHKRPDGPELHRTFSVDFVPGCAMLIRAEVIEEIGFLDGEYFAYHEDVDFCIRASEAGFGVECIGDTVAMHQPHSSTGGGYNPRRKYMMAVNAVWFLRRHGTPRRWLRFVVFDILTLPGLLLYGFFKGHTSSALAKVKGTLDGARGRKVTANVVEGRSLLW